MNLVLYGDFNCPYSCLASVRADALCAAGRAQIEWRAVEHDPSLPVPSRPVTGDVAEMFDRELDEINGLLRPGERFPIAPPPVQPNSRLAIEAYAGAPDGDADDLRRRLFAALWFEGRDIADPAVLAELVGDAALTPDRRSADWQAQWAAFDRRLVPMLVLPDGYVSRGLGALERLADLAA